MNEGVDPRQRVPDTIVTKGFHATWNNLSLSWCMHTISNYTGAPGGGELSNLQHPPYIPVSADTSGKHPDPGSKIRKLRKPTEFATLQTKRFAARANFDIDRYTRISLSLRKRKREKAKQSIAVQRGLLTLLFSFLHISPAL